MSRVYRVLRIVLIVILIKRAFLNENGQAPVFLGGYLMIRISESQGEFSISAHSLLSIIRVRY